MEKISIEDIANEEEVYLANYLECPIDCMISINSLMCKKCETIFCIDCIESWKKKSNLCPSRCNPIELVALDKTIIQQQLLKIRKNCPNKKYGCQVQLQMNDNTRHENNCEYKEISCEKCMKIVPLKFYNLHLYENCPSYQINCFICNGKYSLKVLSSHIDNCKLDSYICEICLNEDNNLHECPLKIVKCQNCELPEFDSYIKSNQHRCIDEKNLKHINTYLESINSKFFVNLGQILKEKEEKFIGFIKKLTDVSNEINKRENDKCLYKETKYAKVIEEIQKKNMNYKDEKIEVIGKIKNESEELKKYIKIKKDEIEYLKKYYEKNKNILKTEYELKISSKKHSLEYFRNLMNLKDENIFEKSAKPINEITIESSKFVGTLFCENCSSNFTDDYSATCGYCTHDICKKCSIQCQNKNYNHINNNFCPPCFDLCSLCREMKQCKSCIKKCFYKNCVNLLCHNCYDKNKHQLRAENTNCKFYKCDSCRTDGNCIMTTVYCPKCDRRICSNCFHKDHNLHN